MLRKLLALFGYRIEYVHEWGRHDYRYSAVDYAATRPIHQDMSVAPPWAKMRLVKIAPPVRAWLCLKGHGWVGDISSNCPACGRRPSTEAPK